MAWGVTNGSNETLDIVAQKNVEAMQIRKFASDFGRLLKRPWFRRTRIVQEFVFGRTLPQIVCGLRTISYGNFIATHWALPRLMDRVSDMTIAPVSKIVDSNGNVVFLRVAKRKLPTVWKSHDEGETTLATMTNLHRGSLDDEVRLYPWLIIQDSTIYKGL